MEVMEKELQKLKGKEQDQHEGPLLKLPTAALGGGKMHPYPEEEVSHVIIM